MLTLDKVKLAIIGLGHVGLPLAVEFGKKRPVVGLNINTNCVAERHSGQGHTCRDVRYSLVDIGKSLNLNGYAQKHRTGKGLKDAMDWYVDDLDGKP